MLNLLAPLLPSLGGPILSDTKSLAPELASTVSTQPGCEAQTLCSNGWPTFFPSMCGEVCGRVGPDIVVSLPTEQPQLPPYIVEVHGGVGPGNSVPLPTNDHHRLVIPV